MKLKEITRTKLMDELRDLRDIRAPNFVTDALLVTEQFSFVHPSLVRKPNQSDAAWEALKEQQATKQGNLEKILSLGGDIGIAVAGFMNVRGRHNLALESNNQASAAENARREQLHMVGELDYCTLWFRKWVFTIGIVWPSRERFDPTNKRQDWLAIVAATEDRFGYPYEAISNHLNDTINAMRKHIQEES